MNEVKETVDRIGERLEPSLGGLPELEKRRRRTGARRRAAAGSVAVVVSLAGSVLVARAFFGPTADSPADTTTVASATVASVSSTPGATQTATCPIPSGDSPPPVILASTSEAAGSSVQVSGSFQTNMSWLQLWWNADDATGTRVQPPPWPPTGPDLRGELDPHAPGLMTQLAAIAGPASNGTCSFTTMFTVPDVPPGSYQLVWVFGAPAQSTNNEPAFALFTSRLTFDVSG